MEETETQHTHYQSVLTFRPLCGKRVLYATVVRSMVTCPVCIDMLKQKESKRS